MRGRVFGPPTCRGTVRNLATRQAADRDTSTFNEDQRRYRSKWYDAAMRKLVTCLVLLLLLLLLLAAASPAYASSGWSRAKNVADDIIYAGKDRTLYCGCV